MSTKNHFFVTLFTLAIAAPNFVRAADSVQDRPSVFEIDGRKLYYRDIGTGLPVLILHGARLIVPGSWDETIDALVGGGYRVIYPQRAGRGKSDPHPVYLSLARDTRDMWALADHLKLKKVVLIGHSQGAFVARDLVLNRPKDVLAIVSEDSDSFGTLKPYAARASIDRFDTEDRASYEKYQETLRFVGRSTDYPSDYNVRRILMSRQSRPANDWKWQQVPDPADARIPEGRWCKVPLLVFTAGRGRIRQSDPETGELAKKLPAANARLVVVTKSGHGIHEEQPGLFNREVLTFLKSIGSQR